MPVYVEKICDMRTLLKYAENVVNKRNMRQSHIGIKRSCLIYGIFGPMLIGQLADMLLHR